MSGTVVVAKHKIFLIPESCHKIPCLLNFTHPCKEISHKIKGFVKKQLSSLKKILQIRLRYFSNSSSGSDDEEGVLAGSDQDDEEKTRESNEPPKQASNKQPLSS